MLAYIRALNAIDGAMRVAIPSLERLADVLGLALSRQLAADGSIVFDLWRLRW
ncbi:hypothetical protein GCM10010272_54100 [Streptomyces lateritius]|nr:hypothetical protein GCM10010272_54100 [Streptomyces lateritius]